MSVGSLMSRVLLSTDNDEQHRSQQRVPRGASFDTPGSDQPALRPLTAPWQAEVGGGCFVLSIGVFVVDVCEMLLQTCLAELANISTFFRDMLDSAFAQLCSSFVKNQVKGLLQPFASLKYTLTEVRALVIPIMLTRVNNEVSLRNFLCF